LVYADDISLLTDSINTIKENTQTHLEVIRDVGLDVNAGNPSPELRTKSEYEDR
jgi:hypothetical protein